MINSIDKHEYNMYNTDTEIFWFKLNEFIKKSESQS